MACVYILINETIPGLLKIGFTGGTAADRAADISRGTGVPSPYEVHWFLETTTTEAARAVEQLVHQSLATDRYNRAREFFTTSLPVAIDTIERIAYQHGAIANDLTVITRFLEEERAQQQQAQREQAQLDAAEQQQIQREQAQLEQVQREQAQREEARRHAAWEQERVIDALAKNTAASMNYMRTLNPIVINIRSIKTLTCSEVQGAIRELEALCGREGALARINKWVRALRTLDDEVCEFEAWEAANPDILATPSYFAG
jgi:hypothetical protein